MIALDQLLDIMIETSTSIYLVHYCKSPDRFLSQHDLIKISQRGRKQVPQVGLTTFDKSEVKEWEEWETLFRHNILDNKRGVISAKENRKID